MLGKAAAVFCGALLLAGFAAPLEAQAHDYERSVSLWQGYIASKAPLVKNEGNLPFLLTHGRRTARAILLVHGLSDSPYYVRALADVFYAAGYNVAAVLLPGHGTKPEDLLSVRLGQWRSEVAFGVDAAAGLGDELSLGGFSTGGALILDAVAGDEDRRRPRALGDLFLFSPALRIHDLKADLVCPVSSLAARARPWAIGDARAPEDDPYRYKRMALNAVCQLSDLTRRNEEASWRLSAAIAGRVSGVFAAESAGDTVVSPEAVAVFMGLLPLSTRHDLVWYPKDAGIKHSDVPRPERNPRYAELAARIQAFIASRPVGAAYAPRDASVLRRLRALIETGGPF